MKKQAHLDRIRAEIALDRVAGQVAHVIPRRLEEWKHSRWMKQVYMILGMRQKVAFHGRFLSAEYRLRTKAENLGLDYLPCFACGREFDCWLLLYRRRLIPLCAKCRKG